MIDGMTYRSSIDRPALNSVKGSIARKATI